MVAAAVTYLATPVVRRLALRAGAFTEIRERDVHDQITPRWGGLGMYFGLVVAFALASQLPMMSAVYADLTQVFGLLGGVTVIVVIGLIDDRWGLDAPTKFAGQALAAGLLAWQGIGFIWLPLGNATVLDPLTSTLLTLLVVLVCVNAVNFVDGLDGLAAGTVAGATTGPYTLASAQPAVSYTFALREGYDQWPEFATPLEGRPARTVVLTTGTFLAGLIHVGLKNHRGGRAGDPAVAPTGAAPARSSRPAAWRSRLAPRRRRCR